VLGWWRTVFDDPKPVAIPVYLVCGIIVFIRRHHIEPSVGSTPPAPATV